MNRVLLASLFLAFSNSLFADDPKAEVLKAEQAYRDAANRHDVAALGRLLTDDFQFIARAGNQMDKTNFLDAFKEGRFGEPGEHAEQTIHLYGEAALLT